MFVFCSKTTQLRLELVSGHDPENHKGIPMLPVLTHSPLNSSFDASSHRLRLEVHEAVELHHYISLPGDLRFLQILMLSQLFPHSLWVSFLRFISQLMQRICWYILLSVTYSGKKKIKQPWLLLCLVKMAQITHSLSVDVPHGMCR